MNAAHFHTAIHDESLIERGADVSARAQTSARW